MSYLIYQANSTDDSQEGLNEGKTVGLPSPKRK